MLQSKPLAELSFVRKYSLVSFLSIGAIISAIAVIMASAKVSIKTRPLDHRDERIWRKESTPAWPLFGFHPHTQYNWDASTEDNYRSSEQVFAGRFSDIRQRLDLNYHASYTSSRQLLQDAIIESMLTASVLIQHGQSKPCTSYEPWIIFTAGVMGAGKTHTIKKLHSDGQFPLQSFVTVDPDEMRRLLPEFNVYVGFNAETAGELTRKEAGMMAEILTVAALERGQNVLVDGSLRDAPWYQMYFLSLRETFPQIKLGIIHVTAPIKAIFERVKRRGESTGRVVPEDVLLNSIEQVPKSVMILKQQVDFFPRDPQPCGRRRRTRSVRKIPG
mmetsp:Transcript_120068/g.179388  ORF Transcript_120068/g.179388 Transcript_120068/m.179388 type:complete len:331 (+) Transcript_120068:287-1279(+)